MTTSTRLRGKRGKKDSRNDAVATSDNGVAMTTANAVVVVNDEKNKQDNYNNEGDPVEVKVRVELEVEAPINEQKAVDNNEKKKKSSAETTKAEAAVVNSDEDVNDDVNDGEDDAVVVVKNSKENNDDDNDSDTKKMQDATKKKMAPHQDDACVVEVVQVSDRPSFLGGTVLKRDTVGLGLRYKTEKEREKVHENDILFSSVDLGLRSGSGTSSSTKFLNHTDHSGNKKLQSIIKARKSNYFVNVTNIDSCSIAVNEEERTKIAKEIFHEITTTTTTTGKGVGIGLGVGRFLNFKSMNKAKYDNLGIDFVWEIMDEITSIIKICQNINYIFMSDNERTERNLAIEIQQKQHQNDYRNERKQKNGKTLPSSDKKSKTKKSTKQSKILLQQRQQEQEQRENAQIQEQQLQQQQQQQCQQVQMRIYQLQQQLQQQVYYPPTQLIQQYPTAILPKDGKKKTKREKRKAPVTAAMANERTGIIEVRGIGNNIVIGDSECNSENKNNDIVQEHDIVLFDSIEAGRKKENVNDNANDDHDDTYINTKYCIINDKGHYQEHIGNENLVKLIVKKKSDYDYIEGQDVKKLGIARIRQDISLNIVNFIVKENGGRFLFCSKKDADVDVDLLETPTAEATIGIIKDGEDAIARAEAALRGEKTPTKTSKDIEDEDEDDIIKNEDSGPVVWEELKDEIMIQAIVRRCIKDIYKLADERKEEILEKRKEAKKERKRLREEQRQQQQQEQEQEQFQVQLRQQQQQQHEQFQLQQQMNMIMMMNQQSQQQQHQQPQYYNSTHQKQNSLLTGGTSSEYVSPPYQKKRKQQAVEKDPSGRKNKSCDFCRDKKLKCNRTSPCENCTTKYMKDHNLTRYVTIQYSLLYYI